MRKQSGFSLLELLFILWGAFVLSLLGWGVYAIVHFVHKFW